MNARRLLHTLGSVALAVALGAGGAAILVLGWSGQFRPPA